MQKNGKYIRYFSPGKKNKFKKSKATINTAYVRSIIFGEDEIRKKSIRKSEEGLNAVQ